MGEEDEGTRRRSDRCVQCRELLLLLVVTIVAMDRRGWPHTRTVYRIVYSLLGDGNGRPPSPSYASVATKGNQEVSHNGPQTTLFKGAHIHQASPCLLSSSSDSSIVRANALILQWICIFRYKHTNCVALEHQHSHATATTSPGISGGNSILCRKMSIH